MHTICQLAQFAKCTARFRYMKARFANFWPKLNCDLNSNNPISNPNPDPSQIMQRILQIVQIGKLCATEWLSSVQLSRPSLTVNVHPEVSVYEVGYFVPGYFCVSFNPLDLLIIYCLTLSSCAMTWWPLASGYILLAHMTVPREP